MVFFFVMLTGVVAGSRAYMAAKLRTGGEC